jgi:sugar lactone lactonase YvrE
MRYAVPVFVVLAACGGSHATDATGPQPPADGGTGADASAGGSFSVLSLVAGQPGGLGNVDATGSTARFTRPWYAADDARGHLYVSDGDAVRRIDEASGAVTTLAGIAFSVGPTAGFVDGVGADARFNQPTGLVVDASQGGGTLYVSDAGNSAVRALDPATGAVTTIVHPADVGSGGPGAPRFTPVGVALDGAGNLYVADFGNIPAGVGTETGGAVYRVSLSGGGVTLLAGAPVYGPARVDGTGAAARFRHLRGLAFDGQGGLYAADECAVRRIDVSSAAVTTLAAQACAARLYGLASDGAGTLYAADEASVILAVATATGTVRTIAGQSGTYGSADGVGAAATFSGPTGVALGPDGTLRIADTGNTTIRALATATAAVTTLAGAPPAPGTVDGAGSSARFDAPQGATFDGTGTLYVVDWADDTVRAVDVASGAVRTLAGKAGVTGSADGTGSAATFYQPTYAAYDGSGHLYVSDSGNFAVRRIDVATAAVTTVASGGFVPEGVAMDGSGNLYVADSAFSTILRVDPKTGATSAFAGAHSRGCATGDGVGVSAGFCGPQGLVYDGSGNLYVTDNQTVRRIELATAQVTTIAGSAGGAGTADGVGTAALFDGPSALAYDGAGHLFVADSFNATVRRIDVATGVVTTAIGRAGQYGVVLGPIATARLNGPEGLAVGPGGALFVTDIDENVVLLAR